MISKKDYLEYHENREELGMSNKSKRWKKPYNWNEQGPPDIPEELTCPECGDTVLELFNVLDTESNTKLKVCKTCKKFVEQNNKGIK